MKYFVQLFICVLIITTIVETSSAQTEKGDKEISISSSFMSLNYEGFREPWSAAKLTMRMGIHITENIEIEPEMILSNYRGKIAGAVFSGNLLYNFKSEETNNKVVPFVLCGVGISNAVLAPPDVASYGSVMFGTVYNLGCGVKIFLSESSLLRVEYRFQKMFGSSGHSNHMVLIGISIFF